MSEKHEPKIVGRKPETIHRNHRAYPELDDAVALALHNPGHTVELDLKYAGRDRRGANTMAYYRIGRIFADVEKRGSRLYITVKNEPSLPREP
jgi:hypothetical protein